MFEIKEVGAAKVFYKLYTQNRKFVAWFVVLKSRNAEVLHSMYSEEFCNIFGTKEGI